MSARDDDSKTARQHARSKQKRMGDRSADVANALMKLQDHVLKKLEIDDELREEVERARSVTSLIARRRAERTLAGVLRRIEIGEVEAALAKVAESANADAQHFHLAEQWRARLIEEGTAALASFPGGSDDEFPRLIDAAKRERDTGRPPGAARALFRHIVQLLKAPHGVTANLDAASDDESDGNESDSDE